MSGTRPADPLSPEFDIVVDGETYTFRKPGIFMPIEVGHRAADVRRRAYPAGYGAIPNDFALDMEAVTFARHCASIELYLVRADVEWPFSPGEDGRPAVRSDRFPAERSDTVWRLGDAFAAEVARFRTRRNPARPPAGVEAVGGQPGPG